MPFLNAFLPQVRFLGGDDTDSAKDTVHDSSHLALEAFSTRQAAEDALLLLVSETVADTIGTEEDGIRWERDDSANGGRGYDAHEGGGFWFRVFSTEDGEETETFEGRALVRAVSLTVR